MKKILYTLAGLFMLVAAHPAVAQDTPMTFFLTSTGPGHGANLGGLSGADAHCEMLAEEAGTKGVQWHAYLSALPAADASAVNARDRIGNGPWHNATGTMIASSVADLHSDGVNLTKDTQLNENGEVVNGRGDSPNRHDILTGSRLDGTVYPAGDGYDNCANWTGQGEGSTRVGHHDRNGGGQNPTSWNSAHGTRGCSQPDLQGTGGDGLFYCFGTVGVEQPAKP
jgi:hypothetical protein